MTDEMLTGKPPHTCNLAQPIIAKLMTEAVRPLTVLRRNVRIINDAGHFPFVEKPDEFIGTVRQWLERLP